MLGLSWASRAAVHVCGGAMLLKQPGIRHHPSPRRFINALLSVINSQSLGFTVGVLQSRGMRVLREYVALPASLATATQNKRPQQIQRFQGLLKMLSIDQTDLLPPKHYSNCLGCTITHICGWSWLLLVCYDEKLLLLGLSAGHEASYIAKGPEFNLLLIYKTMI